MNKVNSFKYLHLINLDDPNKSNVNNITQHNRTKSTLLIHYAEYLTFFILQKFTLFLHSIKMLPYNTTTPYTTSTILKGKKTLKHIFSITYIFNKNLSSLLVGVYIYP